MPRSNSPHRVGVIFDLDGTLADTLDDLTESVNAVLAANSLHPVTREQIRTLIGRGMRDLLSRASKIDNSARLAELIEQYRRVYRDRMFNHTRLYPAVDELLDVLNARDVPMAVLSNKPDEFTVPIADRLLGRWRFAAIRGARAEPERKPDPTLALALASTMGLDPAGVYLVGDSAGDVETAHNAGMSAVAVTWGYRTAEELRRAGADHLISHPLELPAVIGLAPPRAGSAGTADPPQPRRHGMDTL